LVELFRSIFFQGIRQPKCEFFEISQKASLAAQKVLAGHMQSAGHVFETSGLGQVKFVIIFLKQHAISTVLFSQ